MLSIDICSFSQTKFFEEQDSAKFSSTALLFVSLDLFQAVKSYIVCRQQM